MKVKEKRGGPEVDAELSLAQRRGFERTGDMEKRRRPGFGEPAAAVAAATEPASLLPA